MRLGNTVNAIAQLRGAGFSLAATVVRGGDDLFAARLPERLIYVMGAEGEGMDPQLAAACDARLSIPGTGAVESLNVASATAVFLAQWRQRLAKGVSDAPGRGDPSRTSLAERKSGPNGPLFFHCAEDGSRHSCGGLTCLGSLPKPPSASAAR